MPRNSQKYFSFFGWTMSKMLPVVAAGIFTGAHAGADPLTDRLEKLQTNLIQQFSVPLDKWRFHQPDLAGGEATNLDDSGWTNVAPGFSWSGENTKVWFRTTVTIPPLVGGQPTEGEPARLDVGMDDDGEIYVDGRLHEAFHWDEGHYTLAKEAHAGQTFQLAVRGINGPGDGQFHFARLYFDELPEYREYLDEARFAGLLLEQLPAEQQAGLRGALRTSESDIHFTEVTAGNLATVRAELLKAQSDLAPLADLAHNYDVYYIGHAHIDMNWLWPWSETIDVCHRTWNSAMNLMDEFPDFHFVQSQAGAYVPIEAQYPAEFARMQAMVARGQWDPVGGMWNESDTDLPSGEGLARSFLLAQTYFKTKFGRYAVTGWLPDSFGHSWQMPQILRLAGLTSFYHTRCGNEMPFVWWEAPDGSRVLKANTGNYDEDADLGQLAAPAQNENRFQLPQSLTVFGVGDHGGGPTREQILRIQSFQKDPLLPHVHLTDADGFFAQLARRPSAATLPVVKADLQYTFAGCYTTHADLKQALRRSENNLYSAEVLSSLAALLGQPYPAAEFAGAWRPTTFAQFHDIACGSAIHSTYDWMHEQLAPAFRFAKSQTDRSLDYLTAQADTRGPGPTAIVVWNTLATVRDDVVKVPLAEAARYPSVVDQAGRHFPAQATEGGLVFIARAVPAFGHAVYFPDTNASPSDDVTLDEGSDVYALETPAFSLRINKSTGLFERLYEKAAHWNVFGAARDGNALELMGDNGSAWDINYTGENKIITTEGANVSVVDQGPVFVRLRIKHAVGHSFCTQDVLVYGALPRIDIPTTVDWREEHQLLKIRLPVNGEHLEAKGQIPFGSIVRPINGQECPGQKWMDVSETTPGAATEAAPLDLSSLGNARCTEDFDGSGNAYPAELLPAAGVHHLGFNQVPFRIPEFHGGQFDHLVPTGQKLSLPAQSGGKTLYLLAAGINGCHWSDVGFQRADGSAEYRAYRLNDWVVSEYPDNEAVYSFAYRKHGGGKDGSPPKMWIVPIPVPKNANALILAPDGRVHIFAATLALPPAPSEPYGLSILNDGKYGFDVESNVFRLTALRSSSNPDPQPDKGMQKFTYSLYPHAASCQMARTEDAALAVNIPLLPVVTAPHPPAAQIPAVTIENVGGRGELVVSALKASENKPGFVLRFYEAGGEDTQARIACDGLSVVVATDLLEHPLDASAITIRDHSATVPVGHNQIVTLHFETGPEMGKSP